MAAAEIAERGICGDWAHTSRLDLIIRNWHLRNYSYIGDNYCLLIALSTKIIKKSQIFQIFKFQIVLQFYKCIYFIFYLFIYLAIYLLIDLLIY